MILEVWMMSVAVYLNMFKEANRFTEKKTDNICRFCKTPNISVRIKIT